MGLCRFPSGHAAAAAGHGGPPLSKWGAGGAAATTSQPLAASTRYMQHPHRLGAIEGGLDHAVGTSRSALVSNQLKQLKRHVGALGKPSGCCACRPCLRQQHLM